MAAKSIGYKAIRADGALSSSKPEGWLIGLILL